MLLRLINPVPDTDDNAQWKRHIYMSFPASGIVSRYQGVNPLGSAAVIVAMLPIGIVATTKNATDT